MLVLIAFVLKLILKVRFSKNISEDLSSIFWVQKTDSDKNVSYLQQQLDNLKNDLDTAARGALHVVVNQKREEVRSGALS